jgi:hypothetical protein
MNQVKLINQAQNIDKKVGRKVKLAILTMSPEERLDSLADIIIERIIEENKEGILPIKFSSKGDSS